MAVVTKTVMAPTSILKVGGVSYRLSGYEATRSIVSESTAARARIADPFVDVVAGEGLAATLTLGYRGIGEWDVYSGAIEKVGPIEAGRVVEVEFSADRALRKTLVSVSEAGITAADVVKTIVAEAGYAVGAIDLSGLGANVYVEDAPAHTVAKERSVAEVLRTLRDRLKLPYWWTITAGVFTWAPWNPAFAMASEKPVFTYKENIVELLRDENEADPEAADEADTFDPLFAMPRWNLTSFPHPWVDAGQIVVVVHPKLHDSYPTPLRVDTVTHSRQSGATRTVMALREVA